MYGRIKMEMEEVTMKYKKNIIPVRTRLKLGAMRGESFENAFEHILNKLKATGEIKDYIHHAKHSKEDQEGKDFTLILNSNKEISFGVTISLSSYNKAIKKHPKIACFYFAWGITPNTMEWRIKRFIKEHE